MLHMHSKSQFSECNQRQILSVCVSMGEVCHHGAPEQSSHLLLRAPGSMPDQGPWLRCH